MSMYDEMSLQFGPRGSEGEPLRFRVGHINLIVGPNNSGKSLMLREISGVNPREKRSSYMTYPSLQPDIPDGHIVEDISWGTNYRKLFEAEALEEVLSRAPGRWQELRQRSWGALMPALDEVADELERLRDDLHNGLLAIAPPELLKLFDVWNRRSRMRRPGGLHERPRPLILGAVGLACYSLNFWERQGSGGAGAGEVGLGAAASDPHGLAVLSEVLAHEVLEHVGRTWRDALRSLAKLGVDVEGLELVDVSDWGQLLDKLRYDVHMVVQAASLRDHDFAFERLSIDDPALQARLERIKSLSDWAFKPSVFRVLAGDLRAEYFGRGWASVAVRDRVATNLLYLDGLTRLGMTAPAELTPVDSDDERCPPVLTLFKKPKKMALLRQVVANILKKQLVIDHVTETPQLIWRLSDEAPQGDLEHRFGTETSEFMRRASPLSDRSDGVHALVGILSSILASEVSAVFIDEPEAFLHPPLTRQLARQLSFIAMETGQQFFIATHSAELLTACAVQGAEVNIIRLSHDGSRSTARLLDNATLRRLALDPLCRSESLLSALFHTGAVVCEAASDRVLYQEVNERLLMFDEEGPRGTDSCVFLNAQNWQTIPRMVKPLREMGVAAAAIVDSDVLAEGQFTDVMSSALMPKAICRSVRGLRDDLRKKMAKRLGVNEADVNFKVDQLKGLTPTEQKLFDRIRRDLEEYGVFLVPVGELEDWLEPLGLRRRSEKYKWLRQALDRLGIDPEDEAYVRPQAGDIWDFMRSITAWIEDPEREGTVVLPEED